MTNDNAELITALKEMSTEAKTLRTEVREVKQAGQRNRLMIWLTIASVILDVLLSVALGWNIHQTNETANKTDAVAVAAKSEVCTAFNERNGVQLELWRAVFEAPLFGETPAQATLRETRGKELQPALEKAFALHDCRLTGRSQ